MIVVADTSPITALLHLNLLPILGQLYGQIIIPLEVANELKSLRSFGYDISFLSKDDRFIIRKASNQALVNELLSFIDQGEAEAIILAQELHADLLLIDEKLGKEQAETRNLHCKGVIGVLIDAKHKGYIAVIKPLLDELIMTLKFRLSDHIYNLALTKAGEI